MSGGNVLFKSGGTSSSLTEYRKERILYANYIAQQQKLKQGCQSRLQLGNEPGAVNSGLIPEIKKGGVFTTITEQAAILAENSCTPLIITPNAATIYYIQSGPLSLRIYFIPPTAPYGGDVITGYRYSVDNGATFTYANGTSSPILITGLTFGVTYQVLLQAVDPNGFGPVSNMLTASVLSDYETAGVAQWATMLDTKRNDQLRAIACDDDLNVYISGFFSNDASGVYVYDASGITQSLTPYTIPYTTGINITGFVTKYSPNGNCQWISCVNIVDANVNNYNIINDNKQYIYVTLSGNNNNGVFFDASGFSVTQSPITIINCRGCIYKLNRDGITQWASGISQDTPANIRTNLLTTNTNNDVYYGGVYAKTGTDRSILCDVSGSTQSNSLYSIPGTNSAYWWYIVKINSDGKTLWATYIPSGTNAFDALINGIATDINNNLYFGMSYNNNITIPEVSGYTQTDSLYTLNATLNTAGLIKYNSNGKVQWCVDFNGSASDDTRDVTVDSENNIYWLGIYTSNTSGPIPVRDASGITQSNSLITLRNTTATGDRAIFLIKYNSEGKALWATCCDQVALGDLAFKIKIDSLNNVYVCGRADANGTLVIYDASGTTQTVSPISISVPASTDQAAFLVKYNSSGKAQWATYTNGNNNAADLWFGLAVDKANSLYVGGYTVSTVTVYDASGTGQKPSAITIGSLNATSQVASFVKYR